MKKDGRAAFTLVELLVVIAIIGILFGLLVPGLVNAKAQARLTTCLNNLRQIGIGVKLYVDDNNSCYPPASVAETNGVLKTAWPALGGYDPTEKFLPLFPTAKVRPLNAYLPPSHVYRCPLDQGQKKIICKQIYPSKPSNFETVGTSYHYNGGFLDILPGGGLKLQNACFDGLALKPESWMPQPSKYIVMHEPPARLYTSYPISEVALTPEETAGIEYMPRWYQWHNNLGRVEIEDPKYAKARFISPVLFGDGHVSVENFSKSLSTDPYYPYEETKDWIWYKPDEKLAAKAAAD